MASHKAFPARNRREAPCWLHGQAGIVCWEGFEAARTRQAWWLQTVPKPKSCLMPTYKCETGICERAGATLRLARILHQAATCPENFVTFQWLLTLFLHCEGDQLRRARSPVPCARRVQNAGYKKDPVSSVVCLRAVWVCRIAANCKRRWRVCCRKWSISKSSRLRGLGNFMCTVRGL